MFIVSIITYCIIKYYHKYIIDHKYSLIDCSISFVNNQ